MYNLLNVIISYVWKFTTQCILPEETTELLTKISDNKCPSTILITTKGSAAYKFVDRHSLRDLL